MSEDRPTATIVIPAWNAWAATRACLDSLRPTLGVADHVVVVDNGSHDETPVELSAYGWIEVVTNPENRGFATGCNQGAATAAAFGDPIVVFLNNDTVLPVGWLDGLLAPFCDPTVAAAGPRSDFVPGPQAVEVPYRTRMTDPGLDAAGIIGDVRLIAQMHTFAEGFQRDNRGVITEVELLFGFCLAVRREVFEAVGGFDELFGVGGFEDNDLCRRLAVAGYKLVIAHGSFVHHHGHRTFDENRLVWQEEQAKNRPYFYIRSLLGVLDDSLPKAVVDALAACASWTEGAPAARIAAAVSGLSRAETDLLVTELAALPPEFGDRAREAFRAALRQVPLGPGTAPGG